MAPRRTLDETRQLLLETGTELLRTQGVHISIGSLGLIDVCRRAGLKTAGSAYKIWPSHEAFRVELLRHALDASTESEPTIDVVAELVGPNGNLPPLPELIRRAGGLDATQNIASPTYRLYVALWCAASQDPVLAELIRESDEQILGQLEDLYELVIVAYGREWVPPFDARLLATTLSALVEGMVIRSRYDPGRVPTSLVRQTGDDATDQPWHLFACAAEAVIEHFTRPAPPPR